MALSQNEIFTSNLNYLSKADPQLHHQLKSFNPLHCGLTWVDTQEKTPTVIISKDQKEIRLHSNRYPQKEARRFIQNTNLQKDKPILLLGLGLGYHLLEILAHPKKSPIVIVIEQEIKSLLAYAMTFNFKPLYEAKGLYFFNCIGRQSLFHKFMPLSTSLLANGVQTIKHGASLSLSPEKYSSLPGFIDDFLNWSCVNLSTQARIAPIFAENTCQNLKKISDLLFIHDFKNYFEGRSGIIVSAGPSLSKNVHYLKSIKGKIPIFCVDTALRVLLSKSITPDFILSTDFTQNSLAYIENQDNHEPILIVDTEVYPQIIKKYRGTIMISSLEGKSYLEWLRLNYPIPIGTLSKGLSVAHSAYHVAKYMGCTNLAFIGQDLAFTGGKTHVKGASHEVSINKDDKHIHVKGLFSELKTNRSMKVFMDHFELILKNDKDNTYNCTEGGAIINTMINKLFREFISQETKLKTNQSFFKPIEKKPSYQTSQKRLKALRKTVKYGLNRLDSLLPIITTIANAMIGLITSLEQTPINKNGLETNINQFEENQKKLLDYDDCFDLLRDLMVEGYLVKAKLFKKPLLEMDLREEEDQKEAVIQIKALSQFYSSMYQSTIRTKNLFQDLYMYVSPLNSND